MLNLSKCEITDQGAAFIAEVIGNEDLRLKALIMHWNQVRGRGSSHLAKAIKYNHTLQVFDASFNCFGSSGLAKKIVKRVDPVLDHAFDLLMPEQQ